MSAQPQCAELLTLNNIDWTKRIGVNVLTLVDNHKGVCVGISKAWVSVRFEEGVVKTLRAYELIVVPDNSEMEQDPIVVPTSSIPITEESSITEPNSCEPNLGSIPENPTINHTYDVQITVNTINISQRKGLHVMTPDHRKGVCEIISKGWIGVRFENGQCQYFRPSKLIIIPDTMVPPTPSPSPSPVPSPVSANNPTFTNPIQFMNTASPYNTIISSSERERLLRQIIHEQKSQKLRDIQLLEHMKRIERKLNGSLTSDVHRKRKFYSTITGNGNGNGGCSGDNFEESEYDQNFDLDGLGESNTKKKEESVVAVDVDVEPLEDEFVRPKMALGELLGGIKAGVSLKRVSSNDNIPQRNPIDVSQLKTGKASLKKAEPNSYVDNSVFGALMRAMVGRRGAIGDSDEG